MKTQHIVVCYQIALTVYKTVVHSPVAAMGYSCSPIWRSAASSLRELTSADFLEEGFLGVWPSASAEWAFYVQVAVPMRLPDAGPLFGSNHTHADFRPISSWTVLRGESRLSQLDGCTNVAPQAQVRSTPKNSVLVTLVETQQGTLIEAHPL